MSTNTQHSNILKHLRTTKGITVREAMIEYHISSLTKRIHELRGLGYDIVSTRKSHPVTGQKYVRYTLVSEE
jgi:chromosomal replication initiation ATPase DnaA